MIFTADPKLAQAREETLHAEGTCVVKAEPLGVFSVPDIMVISVLALLLFGPDQLPKMMRQAGRVMRDVQNTSHSFIAEMERAADASDNQTPPPMPPPPPSTAHPTDDATTR